jgi:hypothetical protein
MSIRNLQRAAAAGRRGQLPIPWAAAFAPHCDRIVVQTG